MTLIVDDTRISLKRPLTLQRAIDKGRKAVFVARSSIIVTNNDKNNNKKTRTEYENDKG